MQISRHSLILLAGAAASALILSACGGGSSTPTAQAALAVAAASTTLDPSATTLLSVSGGSGTGATTYNATGACTVSGTTLTAASTGGACSVTATKAADSTYSAITSSALTVTVRAPQAALTVAAASTSLSAGGTTNLSTTGGSGAGAVTYQVTAGGCTVSAAVLTAPAADATCSVTATKAADGSLYAQATSTNTLTVTVTVPATTFLTFDETTPPVLTSFGGDVGTIAADPAGGTNKVMKVVKSDGNEVWAGVTMSKCSYPADSLPVIPLTATNKKMSLRVYSTVANKVLRLKLENAANGAINVEMDATVTAANTWQTLTFDITQIANNGGTATRTWLATDVLNKASVFPDIGNRTAVTMYVDDLKFVGVANVAQTCATPPQASLPVTFDDSALTYTVTDFGGNSYTIDTAPTGGTQKAVKVVKGAAGTPSETWAGTTVLTGTIPFTTSAKTMTVRVWAPSVGKTIRLKAEHLTDSTIAVETDATTTVAGGWQTLTFNFAAQAANTAALDPNKTYSKVSIFFDFNVRGTGEIYWFDTIAFGN